MSGQPLHTAGTDVMSGIHTDVLLEGDPPSFWVEWINWDSDFRRELRVNDRIIGVDGASLAAMLQPQQTFKGIGQYGEGQYWIEIGAAAGQEVTLSVLRDDEPVTVRGHLGTNVFYYDRDGKSALAPGGPARLARDTFDSAWSGWYESLQKALSLLLTRVWINRTPTRPALAEMLAHQPRIDYLLANYPGLFAQTLHDDWHQVVELVSGKRADPPINLEYRTIGAQRIAIAIAKENATKAWHAVRQDTASERIAAAPATSPFARTEAVGKLVELPALGNHNMLNDLGKAFFAAGSRTDGYWFMMLDSPAAQQFYEVLSRFQGQINPQISEHYRFLARVLDDAWMLTVDGRATSGIAVEPIAALAGDDEMFVDLRRTPPQFAGQAELSVFATTPRDDTSSVSVIEAMIQAVKAGDEVTWRSVFAPWRTQFGRGGRTIINMSYADDPRMYESDWDRSRRNIMSKVYDVRIAHAEKIRRVLTRDTDNGLPDVDQTVVWVDHYGLFDGEHRVFQEAGLNRRWPLQRIDGGPWRIITIQAL